MAEETKKRVAIIGNGPSVLRSGLGTTIDSFDQVWRFNNFVTEGFEQDVGRKTTCWVTTLYADVRSGPTPEVTKLILPLNIWPMGSWSNAHNRMLVLAEALGAEYLIPNSRQIERLRAELGGRSASSGLTALALAIDLGFEVSCAGFDGFANPMAHHYFAVSESRPSSCPHDPVRESEWLQLRVARGEITNLSSPNQDSLVDQYSQLHSENRAYGSGTSFHSNIQRWALGRSLKSVLDYGCGKNGVSRMLGAKGVDALGYDPSIPEYSELPERSFDGVCCLDVLEHVPAAEIRGVLGRIQERASKTVFLNISTRPAVHRLPNGRNCHETVCSATWWRGVIREFMPDFEIAHDHVESDHYYLVLVRFRKTSLLPA